jgi:hypothetical protein
MPWFKPGPFQPIPDKSDLWLDLAACKVPCRFDLECAAVRPVSAYLMDCLLHGYSFFAAPRYSGSPWFLVTLDRGWAALSAKSKLEVVAYMACQFRLLTCCVTSISRCFALVKTSCVT